MSQLSAARTRMLFAAICVNEKLCRRAITMLRDDDFGLNNAVYRFLFDVLLEFWDAHKRLPSPEVLRSNLLADLASSQYSEPEDEKELAEVYRLVEGLVKEDPEQLRKSVYPYLDTFKESCVREKVKTTVEGGDLGDVLRATQLELRQAMVTDADRFSSPLDSIFEEREGGSFTLIGNPLVDIYTGGLGPATGDVIGHAAPSGSGKSTLATQTALDVTMIELATAAKENRRPRITYLFSYEEVQDPLTHTLAYGARVPRDTVEQFLRTPAHVSALSSGRNYKPYELKKFRKLLSLASTGRGAYPLAERERIQRLYGQIRDPLRIVDFGAGNQEVARYSFNFVDGIVDYIEEHQLLVGSPGVTAVFVDYASAAARMYIGRPGSRLRPDAEYGLLIDFSLQLKHKVSKPMRCWSWLVQQLAADEGGKAGGTRPDPAKFKGCKAFAENCDFAFVNGKTTEDTELAIFVHSKVRRGRRQPDMIGRLDGAYSHWRPATEDAVIVGNRVLAREEAGRLAGAHVRLALDQG
jgi:hypothetical protein